MTLPRSQRHLLVRGGTVVTMDAARRVFEGDVLVTEGRIAAVGPDLVAPPATRLLPAEGMVVIPGLVQAHVHLGHRLFRGLLSPERAHWRSPSLAALEAGLSEEDVAAAALLASSECLLSGTTTVADIGIAGRAAALARALEESGLRALVGVLLRDRSPRERGTGSADAGRLTREAGEAVRGIDGAGRGRIRACLAPESIESASPALWEAAAGLAAELGIALHSHFEGGRASPRELERLAQSGATAVRLIAAHGVHLDPGPSGWAGDSAPGLVACPSSEMHLGLGTADLSRWKSRAAGGPALGSDGIGGVCGFDPWEEMRFSLHAQAATGIAGGWGAEDAFESATLGGARALGYEQESGSLETGKFGDIVVLDLRGARGLSAPGIPVYERLVRGADARAVRWVVVDGEVVVEGGILPHLESEALARRAGEAGARIRAAVETLTA